MGQITAPRGYQEDVLTKVDYEFSQGNKNVIVVLPTGAGKTIVKAFKAKRFAESTGKMVVVFAHRDVLLNQISLAMAQVGVRHQLMCSKPTEREISNSHVRELGRSYVDMTAPVIVASVQTWVRRQTAQLIPHIGLWLLDETHHLTRESIWHKAVEPLIHAKGLGVTATPLRADGKGLGSGDDNDGVFDSMIVGLNMQQLIESGNLSPYRVYTPPCKINMSNIKVNKSDYNQKQLLAETDKPDITGDAVEHYIRLANGKQAITFCVTIEHAEHVANEFNNAGIKTKALSSKTPTAERQKAIRDFKAGKIKNLTNCDLFSEGFDVPSIEVVIMLRATKSYGMFKQQFGRALRLLAGKLYGILIDHVGNVAEHCKSGMPHDDPVWSLERPPKRGKFGDSEKPILKATCSKCFMVYYPESSEPSALVCPAPDCGHVETKAETQAKQKELLVAEGQLIEYAPEFLNSILEKRKNVDKPVTEVKLSMENKHANALMVKGNMKRHLKRQESQRKLRPLIQMWCERLALTKSMTHEVIHSEFKRQFGVDPMTAQTLGESQADELRQKIEINYER
ncbi:MAG: DEAD/DEAH box helicase [Gammaproteobacteria bacterium]|nr:DEAD/DEAH box helicase [Gammaproteobacteria bacterium]